MSSDVFYVVQLRLTKDEWEHVSAIADLRGMSVEELLLAELRMGRPSTNRPPREKRPKLRVVATRETADTHAAS